MKTFNNWNEVTRTGTGVTNMLIENCALHDSAEDVVKLTAGCDSSVIRLNEVFRSGLWWKNGHDNDAPEDPKDNAEGIDAVNVDGAIVEDNHFYDIWTNGLYYKGGSTDTIIQRNLIERVGVSGQTSRGCSGIAVGEDTDPWFIDAANTSFYESIGSIVRNNIVMDCPGAGISIQAATGARIYHNTLTQVAAQVLGGLSFRGLPEYSEYGRPNVVCSDVHVVSNIVSMAAGARPAVLIRPDGLASGEMAISFSNCYYDADTGGAQTLRFWDERAATWEYVGLPAWRTYTSTEVESIAVNPGLDENGRLLAGSDCIDAGIDLREEDWTADVIDDFDRKGRPLGMGFDVGAVEWN